MPYSGANTDGATPNFYLVPPAAMDGFQSQIPSERNGPNPQSLSQYGKPTVKREVYKTALLHVSIAHGIYEQLTRVTSLVH